MNSYLNVETADKFVQFGPNKCRSMVVESMKKKQEFHLSPLEVDTWKSTYDKEGQLVD